MEAQRDYPIETFDPLLRDLVCWGLVTRQEGATEASWQLVPAAQKRLDELRPVGAPRLFPSSTSITAAPIAASGDPPECAMTATSAQRVGPSDRVLSIPWRRNRLQIGMRPSGAGLARHKRRWRDNSGFSVQRMPIRIDR